METVTLALLVAVLVAQHSPATATAATATTSTDVFVAGEAGYFCIKIPYILSTASGALLAWGEARVGSCSDYTRTDLVFKRSDDGGVSWSALRLWHGNISTDAKNTVYGNAAPVQHHPSLRIHVPFCQDNAYALYKHSDDDGRSWSSVRNLTAAVVKPDWRWIGYGPPAGVQLASGRLVVPGYHTPFHNLDGEFSHDHITYSDDNGATWRLGFVFSNRTDKFLSNECQAVQLQNNSLLLSARTLTFNRAQAVSHDGGLSFSPMVEVGVLTQPLSGIEGSVVKHPPTQALYLTNTHEASVLAFRYNLTLFRSTDYGSSWHAVRVIDPNPSGYSALTVRPDNSIGLLYERSKEWRIVFQPDRIVYTTVVP